LSQLTIATDTLGTFNLNVLAFSSPIFGSISGAQTRDQMHWYPIKANQPEIQFDVQFFGEKDYESFQNMVHLSQRSSLTASQPMVHLNWPERNINNWSGLITQFQGGGMRFNPAPRAKFTVFLFDSFVSQYNQLSELASTAADFGKYFVAMANGVNTLINLYNPYGMKLPAAQAFRNSFATNPSGNNNNNIVIPSTISATGQ